MPILEVPNAFTMLVPDGWSATHADGTYELTRPGDDGAAHVSVYERNGEPLSDDEAADVLRQFISSTGTTQNPEVTVLNEGTGQRRAVARFSSEDEGRTFGWIAFAVIWSERMMLCSCTSAVGSPMLAEAEQMFATIFKPKRGLFRRR